MFGGAGRCLAEKQVEILAAPLASESAMSEGNELLLTSKLLTAMPRNVTNV